jgi:hypothetical protein
MSKFIDALRNDIQHTSALIDEAQKMAEHAQNLLAEIEQVMGSQGYKWERYGISCKLAGRQLGPRGWMGYKWKYIVEVSIAPTPGRVLVKSWDHTMREPGVNVVSVINNHSLEYQIREAVTQWHTEGRYK